MMFKKKKFSKKQKHEKTLAFYIFLFVIATVISVVGMHNVDNCRNMLWVEKETGLNLVEQTVTGKEFGGLRCHAMGMTLIAIGVYVLALLCLTSLINSYRKI